MKYAFRCRNCNSLEPAALAGERDVPIKCPTCGAGVKWEIDAGGNPIKTELPENWEVLADATPERLATIHEYHGGSDEDGGEVPIEIERHVPFYAVRLPDGSNLFHDDGTLATLPLGTEPPEGMLGPDATHLPVMVAVEATEDVESQDKPGAAAARGAR